MDKKIFNIDVLAYKLYCSDIIKTKYNKFKSFILYTNSPDDYYHKKAKMLLRKEKLNKILKNVYENI